MIRATITLDGKNYGGEDYEKAIAADVGGRGLGLWNHHEIDELIIGCEIAKELHGTRTIRSEIDKIIRRIELRNIKVRRIVIEIVD